MEPPSTAPFPTTPLLPPRGDDQPRRRQGTELPVHADLAVRRGRDRPRLAERRTIPVERARELILEAGASEEAKSEEANGGDAAGAAPALEDPSLPGAPEDDLSAARDALIEGASKLAQGVRMSLDGYAAQEGARPIERVVAAGPGTTIPGLTERLAIEIGQTFETMSAPALAHLGPEEAARLTISYGLALER